MAAMGIVETLQLPRLQISSSVLSQDGRSSGRRRVNYLSQYAHTQGISLEERKDEHVEQASSLSFPGSASDLGNGWWRRIARTEKPHSRSWKPQVRLLLRAFARDATEVPSDDILHSLDVSYFQSTTGPLSLPGLPKNRADDSSLHNPLLRAERMGCGWLGVVLEWEGVVVESDVDLERKAWCALAQEEGRPQPPLFVLKRAEGMKNEQALSEVLCWSRDYRQLKRLATRKEELFEEMQGETYRLRSGAQEFLQTLKKFRVPMALASTRPRRYLDRAIEALGMEGLFSIVIGAEDVFRGKPDPEMFMYAAERLSFIPERCIVFGNSNSSVEAAHDGGMKCVAVAGKHPVFELGAADLVVRRLDDLSVVDLKNLADLDAPEFQTNPEPEPEPEVEEKRPLPRTAYRDDW